MKAVAMMKQAIKDSRFTAFLQDYKANAHIEQIPCGSYQIRLNFKETA